MCFAKWFKKHDKNGLKPAPEPVKATTPVVPASFRPSPVVAQPMMDPKPVPNPAVKPVEPPVWTAKPEVKPAPVPVAKPVEQPAWPAKPEVKPEPIPVVKPVAQPIWPAKPEVKPEPTPVVKPVEQPVWPTKPEVKPIPTPIIKPVEQPVFPVKPEVKPIPTPIVKPAEQPVLPVKPEVKPVPTPIVKPVEQPVLPVKPEVKPEPTPVVKPVEQPAVPLKPEPAKPEAPKNAAAGRYSGKYEVFPEAGLFKYRLKASNGEILVVSQGYSTRNGAIAGIDTFKKNVEGGLFDVYTDKSGYSQFILYNANKSRMMSTGEFYETDARAQSAVESVKKFVNNDKIIQLDEIPATEIREELVKLSPVDQNDNGKIEIAVDDKKEWTFTLKASNAEVLFESNGYASKPGAMTGLESVKKAAEAGNFRVSQDKMNRFQFRLYASNNTMVLTGETYPNLENCLSAVDSVRRFLSSAKIVDKPVEKK